MTMCKKLKSSQSKECFEGQVPVWIHTKTGIFFREKSGIESTTPGKQCLFVFFCFGGPAKSRREKHLTCTQKIYQVFVKYLLSSHPILYILNL